MDVLKRMTIVAASAAALSGPAAAQSAPDGAPIEIKGQVAQYSLSPRGVADGLILADGAEIHVPAAAASQLTYAVRPGDAVTIRGVRTAANPMSVQTVTNEATHAVVEAVAPAAARLELEGRVKMQLHDAQGRLDGVLLEDGAIVRMPPDEAQRRAGELAVGMPLFVSGDVVSTALGKAVAARAFGASKATLAPVDAASFDRWMQASGAPGTGEAAKEGAGSREAVSQAVIDRIEAALAANGIKVTTGGDGAGTALSVSLPHRLGRKAAAGAANGAADTEIATQTNAPLVIKSGPVTIDIGAVIINSND